MTDEKRRLVSTSGKPLHLRIWRPQAGAAQLAAVFLVHGLGEHSGRYQHVARHFTQRGFHVYGPDMVGFGQSGGRRGHTPGGVQTLAKDMQQIHELAQTELGEIKQAIWIGHSMGGLTVLKLMLDQPSLVRQAVVNGPAINSGRSASNAKLWLIQLLGKIVPALTMDHGIANEEICSDPDVVADYIDDPLVHRRLSMGLAASILAEGDRVRQSATQFDPSASLLLLQGAEDRIAHPPDTRAFGEQVSIENKKTLVLEGMRHEVFNEKENQLTFQGMDTFFELDRP